jgi:hypothetical protein
MQRLPSEVLSSQATAQQYIRNVMMLLQLQLARVYGFNTLEVKSCNEIMHGRQMKMHRNSAEQLS